MSKDPYSVLKYPVGNEKAVGLVQRENKLTFIVDMKANKKQIKQAVEEAFSIKVDKVNTLISMKGEKKAYVKLSKEFNAEDVMTNMGVNI